MVDGYGYARKTLAAAACVDDIIADIVRHMPAQQPAGWQLTTQDGRNPLCFATVGKLKYGKPIRDQGSLNSYVLGHFGVSSFTYDRGYYIGHVVGYLFSCYYCAHLSITYGVTALDSKSWLTMITPVLKPRIWSDYYKVLTVIAKNAFISWLSSVRA